MSKTCQECSAECCRYFCFEIDKPDTYAEFDDIRWYLLHKGVSVHIEKNGDWYISIANRCKALGPDDRCRIYADRPLICRKYDPDNCDYTGGDYDYREVFNTPQDIERYARKVLGEEKFEKRRARSRAIGKTTQGSGSKRRP